MNNWDKEIRVLEEFFKDCELPDSSTINLDSCITVMDARKFVETHLSVVKANKGNGYFVPYLERLTRLKNSIEK